MSQQISPPPGWARDSLTAYLEDFRENQFATFANKEVVKDLVLIDGMFLRLLEGAVNLRPFFPANFMLRAHSAYRSAAGAVMGGQIFESQALLRVCLENAAYGFYIGADLKRMERWLRRDDSPKSLGIFREEFLNKNIIAHINSYAPSLSSQYELLYNNLIRFGAHPNEKGYSLNSNLRREGEGITFEAVYLHGDGVKLDTSLNIAAKVGIWVLQIMQLLYKAQYELLGLRADLEDLRARL